MSERTQQNQDYLFCPFALSVSVVPLDAGTYRVIVDEELIEGLSFPLTEELQRISKYQPWASVSGQGNCCRFIRRTWSRQSRRMPRVRE